MLPDYNFSLKNLCIKAVADFEKHLTCFERKNINNCKQRSINKALRMVIFIMKVEADLAPLST